MANHFFQRHWVVFSLIILAAGVVWIGITAWKSPITTQGLIPAPKEGFLVPDFSLQRLDGRYYTLLNLKGKGIVLNLWATWCAVCDTEMPAFQAAVNSAQALPTTYFIDRQRIIRPVTIGSPLTEEGSQPSELEEPHVTA